MVAGERRKGRVCDDWIEEKEHAKGGRVAAATGTGDRKEATVCGVEAAAVKQEAASEAGVVLETAVEEAAQCEQLAAATATGTSHKSGGTSSK